MRFIAIPRADGGVSIMRFSGPDDRLQRALDNYAARNTHLVLLAPVEIAETDIDAECKRAARTGQTDNFRDAAVFRNGKVEIDLTRAKTLCKDKRDKEGKSKKDVEIDAASTIDQLRALLV